MDKLTFEARALLALQKYAPNHRFVWSNTKRMLGSHKGSAKTICVSKYLFGFSPEEAWDTFLHELAHAMVYDKYGKVKSHGKEWKDMARQLGVRQKASTFVSFPETHYRWAIICPKCNKILGRRHRKPMIICWYHTICKTQVELRRI